MIVSGHKVLVTGGSMGIGFALAEALSQRQNRILIAARRSEHLAEAARRLPGVLTAQCDIAEQADLRRLVETVMEKLGGLSLLVNNAGVHCNHDFAATPPETTLRHVDREIGTNLTGLVRLTALCVPLLLREATSAVVNISSLLAIAPKRAPPSTAPPRRRCAHSRRHFAIRSRIRGPRFASSTSCRQWWTLR